MFVLLSIISGLTVGFVIAAVGGGSIQAILACGTIGFIVGLYKYGE